jgi:subtilisin family serine protease
MCVFDNIVVIVDDIIYFAEAMYQDDLVAQAANYANDMGVPYFSAAGNFARGSWEGPWKEGFGPFGPTLDFTDGEGGEALSLQVRANRDSTIILQWSDPTAYASGLPGPKTDLDLYLEIDGDLAGFSIDANQYRPLEFVFLDEGNTYDIFIERFSGPPPEFIKMIFFGDVERVSSNGDPRTISAGTTFGHANAEGVIGVGAAAYINTPGFGVSPAIPERYTAAGGVPILFDLQGERLDKEQVRQTPAFTAPDGTCTNFFGGLDVFDTGVSACYNFFGTSAAAPNAAAVAALMLQVQPRLQPDDIRGILVRTAEDMDDPSTAWFDHGFDLTTGSGFLNALYAVGETALPLSECKHGKGKRDGKGGKGGKGERRNLSEVVDGVKNRRRLDTSKESTFDLTKLPRSYHEVDPRRGRALERRSSQTAREEPEDGVSSKKTIRGA